MVYSNAQEFAKCIMANGLDCPAYEFVDGRDFDESNSILLTWHYNQVGRWAAVDICDDGILVTTREGGLALGNDVSDVAAAITIVKRVLDASAI